MYSVDFQDNFAPVAHLSSIHTVIALTTSKDWELHQMEVKSVYLNSPIDTTIYMRLPPGHNQERKVACVKWGIYGLCQSRNLWHKTLTSAFNELNLTCSAIDHGIFYSHNDKGTTIVCSSMDDFAIATSSIEQMNKFKASLSNHFKMSDLGELAWILGIQVQRNRSLKMISLSQTVYIDSLVKQFNLGNAPPLSTAINPNVLLLKDQSPSTPHQFNNMQNVLYHEAISSLMYAAVGT